MSGALASGVSGWGVCRSKPVDFFWLLVTYRAGPHSAFSYPAWRLLPTSSVYRTMQERQMEYAEMAVLMVGRLLTFVCVYVAPCKRKTPDGKKLFFLTPRLLILH